MAAGELGGRSPVGRTSPALEQASPGEQKGSGADRGDPARAASGAADPADQLGVVLGLDDTEAAGDDEGVDRTAAAGGGRLGHDPVAARPHRDGVRLLGDDLDGVGIATRQRIRAGENLGRPDHIERLHPREGEDDDPSRRLGRGHARIMAGSESVCNDQ
jgi:hypothetical protein